MALYLHTIPLRTSALEALRAVTGIRRRDADDAYIAHFALGEALAMQCPLPFCTDGFNQRALRVLFYSRYPLEALYLRAEGMTKPEHLDRVDWDRAESRDVEQHPAGSTVTFRVRLCPVKRTKSGERDIGESACGTAARHSVYARWLSARLHGATGTEIRINKYRILPAVRRSNGQSRAMKRPEVYASGQLTVVDGEEFRGLLAQGIGRHKAFGFGMLRISPSKSAT